MEPIERLTPGTRVQVWNDYEGIWTGWFEVAEEQESGYQIRRLSDRAVLPQPFPAEALRTDG